MSKHIGKRIKELRKSLKMTQQELSEGIVTRSFISQLEGGVGNPSVDTLEKLAKRLQTDIPFLLSDSKNSDYSNEPDVDVEQLLQSCELSIEQKKLDSTRNIISQIESTLKKNNYKNQAHLGRILRMKAFLKMIDTELLDAEKYINMSIKQLNSNAQELAKSLNLLGIISFKLGHLIKSQDSFLKALYFTKNYPTNIKLSIETLSNIGILHAHINEYNSSIYYLLQALELSISTDTYFRLTEIYMTLGVCYRNKGEYKESESSYLKALSFLELIEDTFVKAGIFLNLGILYKHMKDYSRSHENIVKSETIYRKENRNPHLINCLIEKLDVDILRGELSKINEDIFELEKMEEDISLYQYCKIEIFKLHLAFFKKLRINKSSFDEIENKIEHISEQDQRLELYKRLVGIYSLLENYPAINNILMKII
ncbi:helix-turn-helix domain-containing protein [Bacillus mobilis]|uniref:helix-turn-helix domain-containing protein n=1 Tax=Bacillus mobilis TaxID=2026190 RepID=UPI003CECB237